MAESVRALGAGAEDLGFESQPIKNNDLQNLYLALPSEYINLKGPTNLRSYQDGHRLVTVRTHGNFIVLPY